MVTLKFQLEKNESNRYGTVKTVASFQDFDMACLIDTGADISVWTSSEEDLLAYFPNAIRENSVVIARGFGQGHEIANIYKIPNLTIADEFGNDVIFKQFICAVIPKEFAHQFVLSYSMFEKSNIHICSYENERNFDINTLEIDFRKKENAVGIKYKDVSVDIRQKYDIPNDVSVIDSVYVFSEETL